MTKAVSKVNIFRFSVIVTLLLYVTLAFLSFFWGQLYFRVAAILSVVILLTTFSVFGRRLRFNNQSLLLLLVAICFIFSSFNWYSTNFKSLFTFLVMASNFIVVYAIIDARVSYLALELPFYILLVWIIVLGAFFGYDPESFNDFLAGSSRNVLSAILIALTIGYIVSRRVRGREVNLLPIIGQVVANFFLFGRTGIVISLLILLIVAIAEKRILFLIFSILVLIFGSAYFFSEILVYIASNTNFESGFETPRVALNLAYFHTINVYEVIFGRDLSLIEEYEIYDGNPHNSLLRLHSHLGFSIFVVFLLSALSLVFLIKDRKFLFLSLFFVVYLRSVLDVVYFFNLFDYGFYMIVFYIFFRRKTSDCRQFYVNS
ncbi:hypothetical protein [Marinobacter sp. PE14]